ncbi:MAG: farnesyl diphosphate synthase [Burkholderiales bacterium]
MRQTQTRVEASLASALPDAKLAPERLHDAMRYAALGGGKRVRALLLYAAGEVSDAALERLDIAAAALELVHAYSLVHDDLPCMDDDVLRRGKPTCHIQYDQATALLVGDSLHSLAFALMADFVLADDATRQLQMVATLAQAAGSRGMTGGQAIDLASVDKTLSLPELEFMHIHKTGALIRAAVRLGAMAGNPLSDDALKSLDQFAKWIGLAFQVIDDVLDAEGNTATLGKTAGKDAENNKPTYVSIMGVSGARDFAHDLQQRAVDALSALGGRGGRLRSIGRYIIERGY